MFGPSSTEAVGLPNTLETRRDAVSWPQQQTELFQFPYYPLFLFTLSPCGILWLHLYRTGSIIRDLHVTQHKPCLCYRRRCRARFSA